MDALDLDALDADADGFDAAVARTSAQGALVSPMPMPMIDRFCSSTDWILPACRALMPPRTPWVRRSEHGWVAMMLGTIERGLRVLEPLEAMWGLACPLVGDDLRALVGDFAADCRRREREWDLALVCGLAQGSPLFATLATTLGRRYRLRLGPPVRRWVADLDGGVDAFLARRSPNLRRTLVRAARAATAMGITWEDASDAADAEALYARVLAVEARSWKGREGTGLLADGMREFYAMMLPRLARRRSLRALVARHDGKDVAFIVGAVAGDTYRGLQFSFDAAYDKVSLGNLAQLEQIRRLVDEGVRRYDLGSEVEYKRRWAEPGLETVTLVVAR